MLRRTAFFGFVLALSLASCDDAQDVTPTTTLENSELTTTSEDLVSLEYLTNESEEVVDDYIEMRRHFSEEQGARSCEPHFHKGL